ncbi:hypothetical protein LGT36_012025 [Demequina sp. TMPB413]|uniref:hypothetical protein n=3 Tax=unclassified Demequina TaxID=2620311 RepID=UPI001CF295D5|nr:hypothetical protein [Demequina sp. TMPB413]UPU87961.1 hypothetical protein LGT36_012025 [Demequina sp. TMPB413]
MVQAGDMIGRRFRLVRSEDYDIPGAAVFTARDVRLHQDVTVHIITSLAPSSVIRAARRAQVIRDRRLTRVLAAGLERQGTDRLAYVVSERPSGVRLDALMGEVAFVPDTAAAIVGEAAATLMIPGRSGIHHGMVRARSLTITPRGRVMTSGLGIEGELGSQAGLGRVRSERADAIALARIFVTAVTGLDADELTSDDLPPDLADPARELCEDLLRGSGPLTLKHLTDALGTGKSSALRAVVAEAPTLWWPAAPLASAEALPAGSEAAALVEQTGDADVVSSDAAEVTVLTADADADAEVAEQTGRAVAPVEQPDPTTTRLRTRFGGAVDDIEEFHDIVLEQNAAPAPSVLEAIFERLHQRFPRSAQLAEFAEAARRRAQTSAPFNVGPLVLALLIVTVFVTAVIGASMITQPLDPPDSDFNNPSQKYPEFTIGQTPTPTPAE